MITIDNLSHRYGRNWALSGLTLQIPAGQRLSIFGPNGAGKTTLLHILATLITPSSGDVIISGLSLHDNPIAIRRQVGLIAHNPLLYPQLNALENLNFFGLLHGIADCNQKAEHLLERVGMWEQRHERIHRLSQGQAQRVAIARSLIHDPTLLLMDEPYSGLDLHAAIRLDTLLIELAEAGHTIVMTTHNIDRGIEISDRFAILVAGRFLYHAESRSMTHQSVQEVYSQVIEQHAPLAPTPPIPSPDTTTAPPPQHQPTTLKHYLQVVAAIAIKDLRSEIRRRTILTSWITFGMLVMVVFSVATVNVSTDTILNIGSSFLWTTFALIGTIGLNQSFRKERLGGWDAMLMMPVDHSAIYLGKLLGNLLFSLVAELAVLATFITIYNPPANLPIVLFVLLLGTIGLTGMGNLLATFVMQSGTRELLLPVMLLPVVIPVIVLASSIMAGALSGQLSSAWIFSAVFLIGYDAIVILGGTAASSFITELY